MPKSVPAVMFIEMAMDSLKAEDPAFLAKEIKEFNELGPSRMSQVTNLVDGDKMLAGYLLGLETARIMIETMPAAIINHVDL